MPKKQIPDVQRKSFPKENNILLPFLSLTIYSRAGMTLVRLAVTGTQPVAVAVLIMSTISEAVSGVVVRLEDILKAR
jgi:hypothetical protein